MPTLEFIAEIKRLKAEIDELLQIIKKLEDTIQRLMDKHRVNKPHDSWCKSQIGEFCNCGLSLDKHRGSDMNDNEGWNIIELMVPDYGTIHLGFKGDRIRIRKAGRNPLVPVDFTFDRENETENIQEIISLKYDVL